MAEFGKVKTAQENDSMIKVTAAETTASSGSAAEINCKPLELTAGLLVGASVLALGAAPALAELPTASDAPLCSLDDGDTAFMMFAATGEIVSNCAPLQKVCTSCAHFICMQCIFTVVMMQTPAMGLA